jgi:predicted ATP-dependent endonuclease of OLD family
MGINKMRLSKIRIENFRSFYDETIVLDDYTCLVGPNGSGKSTVLTALNVFFRNNESTTTNVYELSEEDFHHKNTNIPIRITLTFEDLSEEAIKDFKAYYRQRQLIFFAQAEWDKVSGTASVIQHGSRYVMKDFSEFFEEDKKAPEKRELYKKYGQKYNELPKNAATVQAMTDALRNYEENHPEKCALLDEPNELYGFTRGKNILETYIQWVYIPAVKDASTEQEEGAKTALGQLLERTIRKKVKFKEQIDDLRGELAKQYAEILEQENSALNELKNSLENRIQDWSNPGAQIELEWSAPDKSFTIKEPIAKAYLMEDNFRGEVARFGHGMQRAFLISLLQELASGGEDEEPTLLLGFEEPELYQHPPQAQHVASLLEEISKPTNNTQTILTTHCPYFVPSKGFENIRMIKKDQTRGRSEVKYGKYSNVEKRIADALGEKPKSPSQLMVRIGQILEPSQKELFFTPVAILVEGKEDVAFIATHLQLSKKWLEFRKRGCHIVVANGKTNLSRLLAVCIELDIAAFVVFDGDKNKQNAREQHIKDNSCILKLCDCKDFEPLPKEIFWGKNVIMWSTDIQDELKNEFGSDVWGNAKICAKEKLEITEGISEKNSILNAKIIEVLYENMDKKSEILGNLCDRILSYALESKK